MNNYHYKGIILLLACLLFLAGCASHPATFTTLSMPVTGGHITTTPINSSGCGKPAPIASGISKVEYIYSGGLMRSYLLYLPPGYRETTRYPLVLNFHGHGSNPHLQERVSGFTTLAREHKFIVAYPWGAIGPDGHTGWDTGLTGRSHANDVQFVSDLLNHLQATLCIDPTRIFATGFSNGGGMTNLLACELSGRIAAFAPVSGSYPPVPDGCHPSRPVPILEFHGTADPLVPYTGNLVRREPPITFWLQQWAARDGCAQDATTFYRNQNAIGQQWTHCQGSAVVIGYRISGEGHRWPYILISLRLGNRPGQYTASQVIWYFFLAHPLPSAQNSVMSGTMVTPGKV